MFKTERLHPPRRTSAIVHSPRHFGTPQSRPPQRHSVSPAAHPTRRAPNPPRARTARNPHKCVNRPALMPQTGNVDRTSKMYRAPYAQNKSSVHAPPLAHERCPTAQSARRPTALCLQPHLEHGQLDALAAAHALGQQVRAVRVLGEHHHEVALAHLHARAVALGKELDVVLGVIAA